MVEQDRLLDVVIVGAGLGGLAAAISSAPHGHRVTVLESTPELAEIGAGVQTTPNASILWQQWGICEELEQMSAEPTSLTVHRWADGSILATEPQFKEKIRSRYGAPFLDVHRADLQRVLVKKARGLGVNIILSSRVTSIDFSLPSVATADGKIYKADLVVAADGLWSKCRECFLGHRLDPIPTGDLAYRIILPVEDVRDAELREIIQKPQVHFWIGEKAHVVAYSVKHGQEYNIVLLVPDDLPRSVSRQKGSISEMRALFKGWDPILTRFLDCVKDVDKWKLMYLDPLDAWINDKCNFAMLGDACHPMLPYLAQGANLSMEDGATLGTLLGGLSAKFTLAKALKTYESLRKVRGEAVMRETFKQRDAFHMVDGPEQRARDELFLKYLGREIDCDFPSRWTCPKKQPWLYGYDAIGEAEKVLEEIRLKL